MLKKILATTILPLAFAGSVFASQPHFTHKPTTPAIYYNFGRKTPLENEYNIDLVGDFSKSDIPVIEDTLDMVYQALPRAKALTNLVLISYNTAMPAPFVVEPNIMGRDLGIKNYKNDSPNDAIIIQNSKINKRNLLTAIGEVLATKDIPGRRDDKLDFYTTYLGTFFDNELYNLDFKDRFMNEESYLSFENKLGEFFAFGDYISLAGERSLRREGKIQGPSSFKDLPSVEGALKLDIGSAFAHYLLKEPAENQGFDFSDLLIFGNRASFIDVKEELVMNYLRKIYQSNKI